MVYLVNTSMKNSKMIYDILGEFNTIREAYDYLYNNGFSQVESYKYKANHFKNSKYKNVYLWKEEDLDTIIVEYLDSILK